MKIKGEMTSGEFFGNRQFYMKYIGNIFVQKDFLPIVYCTCM